MRYLPYLGGLKSQKVTRWTPTAQPKAQTHSCMKNGTSEKALLFLIEVQNLQLSLEVRVGRQRFVRVVTMTINLTEVTYTLKRVRRVERIMPAEMDTLRAPQQILTSLSEAKQRSWLVMQQPNLRESPRAQLAMRTLGIVQGRNTETRDNIDTRQQSERMRQGWLERGMKAMANGAMNGREMLLSVWKQQQFVSPMMFRQRRMMLIW